MRRNRELVAALLAVLAVTAIYAIFSRGSAPRSGSPAGHAMGVIGMTLMLATETLYSLRKRAKRVHFGRLHDWLSVHIFMGIFGPYLVLLHTAWAFNGLAGGVLDDCLETGRASWWNGFRPFFERAGCVVRPRT
jgi:hypothetical protein